MKKICVVGMGYVGLTLSVVLAERGFEVIGVEVRKDIVNRLNEGHPHFREVGLDTAIKRYLGCNLAITTDMPLERQDAYVIAVGTPLKRQTKKPIMDYVIRATIEVAECITEGSLVVLRSTVPVGTSRSVVLPILEQKVRKVFLAFCPERTAEGTALKELKELPQIIGGLEEESVDRATDIFRKVTPTIIQVSSLEAAEMVKLLDNSYRDLNFAFANEIALFSERLGLDAVELVRAANMGYPRTNLPVPGFVGGTCLEKDPYILVESVEKVGYELCLIKEGRRINEMLPAYAVDKIHTKMESLGKDLNDAKVLVAGLAFKGQPETDDLRDSPALRLIQLLREHGVQAIYGHDFVVPKSEIHKLGVMPCSLEEGFRDADCAVLMNNHQSYYGLDIAQLLCTMNRPAVFIDGWHIFEPSLIKNLDGIVYGGIGVE